jgi:hypothetical protein
MPRLGTLKCNRCRLMELQDQAAKEKLTLTKRKSFYGMKLGKPGVDIYMHPSSVEIPSHFMPKHNMDIEIAKAFDPKDPEGYLVAWLQEIPPSCECRVQGGNMWGRKII